MGEAAVLSLSKTLQAPLGKAKRVSMHTVTVLPVGSRDEVTGTNGTVTGNALNKFLDAIGQLL
jgi:hypothetical protein